MIFHQLLTDFPTDKSYSERDYWVNSSVYTASIMNMCLDIFSNLELPYPPQGEPRHFALEYAHRHYLGLLQVGMIVGHFLKFSQFVVSHVAILILATFLDEVMNSRLTTYAFFQYIAIILTSFMMGLTLAAFTLFTNPSSGCCYYNCLLTGSMLVTALSAAHGSTGCRGTQVQGSMNKHKGRVGSMIEHRRVQTNQGV